MDDKRKYCFAGYYKEKDIDGSEYGCDYEFSISDITIHCPDDSGELQLFFTIETIKGKMRASGGLIIDYTLGHRLLSVAGELESLFDYNGVYYDFPMGAVFGALRKVVSAESVLAGKPVPSWCVSTSTPDRFVTEQAAELQLLFPVLDP